MSIVHMGHSYARTLHLNAQIGLYSVMIKKTVRMAQMNGRKSAVRINLLLRRSVITYPKNLSDIRKTYLKVASDFTRNFFSYIVIRLCSGFFKSMFRISHFGYRFRYRISFRISNFGYRFRYLIYAFRLCYDASPQIKEKQKIFE